MKLVTNFLKQIQTFAIDCGIKLGFAILKKYSNITMSIEKYLRDQYYKSGPMQNIMDYMFEWLHFFMVAFLYKYAEPFYNPWASIIYMKSGSVAENYFNLKKCQDSESYPNNPFSLSPNSYFAYTYEFIQKITTTPAMSISEILNDPKNLYQILNSIYSTCNFIKTAHFDSGYDFLVLMKTKNCYISRVGKYNGMKNLREEDLSLTKAPKSILMAEYIHPSMKDPITLSIDPGFFIVNNEILSPMFVQRCLMHQSLPYVFDYNYKLRIMDNKISTFTIDNRTFILLTQQGYKFIEI